MTPPAAVHDRQPAVRTVRVVVCEDVAELRALICRALGRYDELEVVDSAGSAHEALRLARRHRPDVLVLDLGIAQGGACVVQALARRPPMPAIVVFSARGPHAVPHAVRRHVRAHVAKTAGLHVLAERVIAAGGLRG